MNTLITGITSGVISVLSFLFDALIGLIVCIYILNSKERFAAQSKKLIYSMFDTERANEIIADARNVHRIFSGFISGKLLDSLIIGMISFVALSCMNMPYAVMISVVVGVTNIIPFFGPFIGAVPSAVIIFTVSPIKSLYFIIYILIIQQIDGNIIGPKILGNSTGLPSFWVLFAIVVGGGLFGFAGMLLGVPVFAVIYMFVSEGIVRALKKRGLPEDTDKYDDIMEIDPETHEIKAFRSEENIKNEQQTVIDTKEDPE
jgi:predicted PurR-regulated permease PerM